jgi:hypothetical protein
LTRGITMPWPVDSLPLSREAVAQTPDGRTGSCGWVEIVEGVAQALRALLDLAAPTASYSRYSERSPGSYGRLYATRSRRSERPRRGPPRARSRQRGSDRVDELRRPREVDVGDAAHAERVRFGLVVLDRRGRAGERELEIREGVYRLSPPMATGNEPGNELTETESSSDADNPASSSQTTRTHPNPRTGGRAVAGSNPVSPIEVQQGQGTASRCVEAPQNRKIA